MKKSEVAKITTALKTEFPNWKTEGREDDINGLWFTILGDVPFDAAWAATLNYITQGHEFAPGSGIIRKEALKLSQGNQLSAEEAWLEVKRNWSRALPGRHVEWSTPLIADALLAINIVEWGYTTDANEHNLRAHFLRIFGTISERKKESDAMLPSVRTFLNKSTQGMIGEK